MSRHSVYHALLAAVQVEVIKRALAATGGNRTHAARLLGLQRTYLLRLMRDRDIDVPRPLRKGRPGDFAPPTAAAPPEFNIEISGWEPLTPSNDRHPAIATEARPSAAELDRLPRGASQAARRER